MGTVEVEIGPVPSMVVLAWLDYAEGVLSSDEAGASTDDIPPDIRESFLTYIHQWRVAATKDAEFHWHTEVPSELAEHLVLAFYRVVQRLAESAAARGSPMSPPGSEMFYSMLVQGLLDALAGEGPGAAEFSDHLRSFWPGLED